MLLHFDMTLALQSLASGCDIDLIQSPFWLMYIDDMALLI